MSPPLTSHEHGALHGEIGDDVDTAPDETTWLLLRQHSQLDLTLPCLEVTLEGRGVSSSSASSCCSSAGNSPTPDSSKLNNSINYDSRRTSQPFVPVLLRTSQASHLSPVGPISNLHNLSSRHNPLPQHQHHHQHHHHHYSSPRSHGTFPVGFPVVASSVQSVFSDIHSECEESRRDVHNESEFYLHSSIVARAFPERMFALTVTLIFEIPVLLMISGGSDALCQLVGRSKYQLLIGFLPLTSAISGNVGLQASTLTTRAISHDHVTPSKYMPWFCHEVGAACFLGLGMGTLLGTIAYVASMRDVAFALTIFVAQFISIVTAGCTGTFAPLLFSFIFRRDSGKWGGPLETAIQDIVGSFAMVIISYHILLLLGPMPIDPDDVCSVGGDIDGR